ncbi:Yip1 family protein [uncultured Tateyamaria sp.]|uniref:Yip1 family protein n=1 Tax=Tateyamaria sp. 1078 TaxID=3417464 RepID=UPI0026303445|nr:Yip1 family protein [uncultured Tateyamaria sp.]
MKFWADLAVDTLRNPQDAAARIMSWQVPRTELYIALLAVSALTALIVGTVSTLGPPADPQLLEAVPVLALFQRPLALFVLTAGGLIVMVHALYWAGNAMGGRGDLGDLIALMAWLQALRVAAQLVILTLSMLVPGVAGLLALVVMIVAFWLMLHFISAALHLASLLRAFGILIAVSAGLLLGLMLIITLFGLAGGVSNV